MHTAGKIILFPAHILSETYLAPLFSSPNVLYQLGKEMESLLVLAPRLVSSSKEINMLFEWVSVLVFYQCKSGNKMNF